MLSTVVNLQRKVALETSPFQDFVGHLRSIDEVRDKQFSVAFISDRRMIELNRFFRGKSSTTDVLSFPDNAEQFETENENNLGDIVISVEQAARQADEHQLPLEAEIKQLMLHGVLHLCGYDHETDGGEMNARELELRDKLGI